jgi:hypothetical protein
MSRIWAIVDEASGLVVNTVHQDFGGLVDGAQYGEGYVARDISNTNWAQANTKCYWDNANECWEALPARPEGEYDFADGEWVFDSERFGLILRADRNKKLNASDWTQLPDCSLSETKQAEWSAYRQQLRDIPENVPSDVHAVQEVVWPTEPS